MKKIKLNFFQKILLCSIALTFLGITSVQIFNLTFLDSFYINRKTEELPTLAKQIEEYKSTSKDFLQYIDNLAEETGTQIILGNKNIDAQRNKNMSLNSGNRRNSIYEPTIEEGVVELKKTKSGGRYLSYTKNIDGIPLHIILPLISMENYMYETTLVNLLSMGLVIILSFILCRFLSKRLTRDIEKLNRAAKKMAHLEFVEKLDIKTDDEIGELAISVEEMSKNLKKSMDSLRNFVSNASHELKTPISVVNMISQNLRNEDTMTKKERLEAYEILIKETEEMGELIQNLMTLSKISYSKSSLNPVKINLKKLVTTSVYKYEILEIEKELEVEIDVYRDIYIFSDYNFLKLVVDNLVQNAMKYSPLNSVIHITFKNGKLTIENQFEKSIEDGDEIFQPFKRGSNTSGTDIDGAGLGLSIVKNILELLELEYSLQIEKNTFRFEIEIDKGVKDDQ